MKSMTGYGYCDSVLIDGVELSVEVKTVNRKQIDIKISMPRELMGLELDVRRIISSSISRGSVYVKVNMLLSSSVLKQTIRVNEELACIYIEKTLEIKKSLGISGELEIKDILQLPGVIDKVDPDIASEELKVELCKTVEKALAELNCSRKNEGLFLKKDILKRIVEMELCIAEIEPLADKLPEQCRVKLQKRLEEENVPVIDDDRLLRELVIYSDKCDVSEEITRLKSHFIQFKKILSSEDKPVGRSLDFLTQEIQREINTLGVKAASTEISPKVVQLKTETEKVREQIQNIE